MCIECPLTMSRSSTGFNEPDGPPERAGFWRPATPDELLMRDSFVHLLFFDSTYQGFHGFNIENGFLWQRNSQGRN